MIFKFLYALNLAIFVHAIIVQFILGGTVSTAVLGAALFISAYFFLERLIISVIIDIKNK